jgi:RNA polymerase sigma-70 factor (ECF subfamily)
VDRDEVQDLVRRAAAGDREAAGELARRYEARVRAAIHRRLGDLLRARLDTEDLFQSAIAASLRDLGGLRYHGEPAFVGWLTQVAERRIRDSARFHGAARRDVGREGPLPEGDLLPGGRTSPTQGALRTEATAGLRVAMEVLPEIDRRVVELHSFQGMGFREVAAAVGLPDKNAARHVFQRVLRRMEDWLDGQGLGEDAR